MSWPILVALAALLAPSFSDGGALPQDDGESGKDAPNACVAGQPSPIAVFPGDVVHGTAFPLVDPADVFTVPVNGPSVVRLLLDPSPLLPQATPAPDFDLLVFDAECRLVEASRQRGGQEEVVNFEAAEAGFFQAQVVAVPVVYVHRAVTLGLANADGPLMSAAPLAPLYCHPPCTAAGYGLAREHEPLPGPPR